MSIRRPVVQFALAGFVVVVFFLTGSLFALQRIGQSEAARDARQFALLSGQGIVEPVLRDGVLSGDDESIAALDQIVQERVLSDRVVRVKIWTRDGRVVYSDEPRLIGNEFLLDDTKLHVLQTGAARSERSELGGLENRFDQGFGDLYEVYVPVRTPNGTPLLFETYQRASAVEATGRRIWVPFAVLVLACLLLLWLVQVPLAHRLARRLERSQHEREALLERSLEASADERRRIAADVHDGVVQNLVGISYSLSAAAERADVPTPDETRAAMQEAARGTRETIRELRSLLVEIHPPNLRAAGLTAAIPDAASRLSASGVRVTLDVEDERLPQETELLFYRAVSEALRNVERHAGASHVRVAVSSADGTARLEVVDDGAGFTAELRDASRAEGHVGLSLLEELVTRVGGHLDVVSRPGAGTSFVMEVPIS